MEIVTRRAAILEIDSEVNFLIDRVSMVVFLRRHTKEEFYKLILCELCDADLDTHKERRDRVRGELWCLFEEWSITDFVEESWLMVNWSGLNL